ncbi:MAG: iron-containing alcohol dehydrogenase [Candidatus Helarchaeota archaeon]
MSVPFRSPLIHFGRGSLKNLRYIRGKKALIVTDKVIKELGILDKVTKQLNKSKHQMDVQVFDEIEPNPMDTTVLKGVEKARQFEPDWIIGLGGGSAMDAAKVIYALYERPDISMTDIIPLKALHLGQKSKLLTISTTSGTGAEVTWGAVITSAEKGIKLSIGSNDIVPDIAIVDSSLALSMPHSLTVATGMDALTHSIEGTVATIRNDFSHGLCLQATKMIFEWLPKVCENLEDKISREKMHNAACIAGLGFGNSQAGLAHGIGHALGALFHIPHGTAVGLMLPFIIEFNEPTSNDLFKEINKFCEFNGEGTPAKILATEVRNFMKIIGAPMSLKECNITQDKFEELLDRAVHVAYNDPSTRTNPREPTNEDILTLIKKSFAGQ